MVGSLCTYLHNHNCIPSNSAGKADAIMVNSEFTASVFTKAFTTLKVCCVQSARNHLVLYFLLISRQPPMLYTLVLTLMHLIHVTQVSAFCHPS